MYRGGGSEGTGGGGNMEKVGQVGRSEVVDGFEGMEEDFEDDSGVNRKPV